VSFAAREPSARCRGRLAKILLKKCGMVRAAGIERESLYRALSAHGNPHLSTLVGVMKAVGLKLTVEVGWPVQT